MNRPLKLAAAALAAGAIIVGTAGCSFGGDDAPATTTVETQAPAPTTTQAPTTVTEQTTVTQQNQNNNNQNNNNQNNQDQAQGEAIGRAEESAGLSEAKKECLAHASAADCANIP
ncbi:MAG: hypothetical protein KGQ95_00940 [Acidobacteria bacterium]|nr:hypothetical protein [Acidobacteriota bacterium]